MHAWSLAKLKHEQGIQIESKLNKWNGGESTGKIEALDNIVYIIFCGGRFLRKMGTRNLRIWKRQISLERWIFYIQ